MSQTLYAGPTRGGAPHIGSSDLFFSNLQTPWSLSNLGELPYMLENVPLENSTPHALLLRSGNEGELNVNRRSNRRLWYVWMVGL